MSSAVDASVVEAEDLVEIAYEDLMAVADGQDLAQLAGEAVDLATLKVVVKFFSIDVTDRIRPYASLSGIQIKEAQFPAGKHTVRISIADTSGGLTAREVAFEVL